MRNDDPVTSASIDAVGGCTRALAASAATDAAFGAANAATLGGLRAFGDRLALRERFEDTGTFLRERPRELPAAAVYDSLAAARVDVLGVRWLPGVARNLLAHPGVADDPIRWLAFARWSGREAPADKRPAAARVHAALPSHLLVQLTELEATIGAHARFAASAASWACAAAVHVASLITADPRPPLPFPIRRASNDIRRGRYARPGSRHADDRGDAAREDVGGASHLPDNADSDTHAGADGYRAYTTAHDRVVNAATLASRPELAALRQALDADLGATRVLVSRLAKRLMRALMAQQAREWRYDLDEGLLDASRHGPFVASRGATRPFKQELDAPFPSTAVSLLIDHSGSMRGRPMRIAAMTVEIFARVFERCGVRCEILGFTTRDWDGGEPARQWARDGYPDRPGRLNALEHIVIKPADVPWRRARVALGLFLRDEMLKENIDGEALARAHARLQARPERRRILVVVSDGTPMDEATFAANGYDYLDRHLAAVVDEIETRSPIQLAAIGIGHDVSRFYRNATRISRIDDLGPALGEKLLSLLAGAP
jgi:cobaltochelatase CobT